MSSHRQAGPDTLTRQQKTATTSKHWQLSSSYTLTVTGLQLRYNNDGLRM